MFVNISCIINGSLSNQWLRGVIQLGMIGQELIQNNWVFPKIKDNSNLTNWANSISVMNNFVSPESLLFINCK